jgi:hypothetical protein
MKGRMIVVGVLMTGLLLAFCPGCGSKVNQKNYQKIESGMKSSEGMTQVQVEAILGKGTEEKGAAGAIGNLTGSAKIVTWKADGKTITVTFVNDKATTASSSGL